MENRHLVLSGRNLRLKDGVTLDNLPYYRKDTVPLNHSLMYSLVLHAS